MQRYGASCYRRNPDHLRDFSHPTCTPPVDTAATPVTPAVDAVGACATTATKPDPQPCAQQMPSDESLKGVEETPAGDDGAPPGKRSKPAPAVTPPAPAPSPSPSPFDWKEACRAALKLVRPFKLAVAEAATDRLDRLENMSGLPIFSRPVRLSVSVTSAPPGTKSNFQSSTMTYGRQPDSPLPLPHARARTRGGRVDRYVTIHAVGQLAAANLLLLEYSQSGRRVGPTSTGANVRVPLCRCSSPCSSRPPTRCTRLPTSISCLSARLRRSQPSRPTWTRWRGRRARCTAAGDSCTTRQSS